jgi:ABC-type spermidine/putrescine transport system permease subunit II
MDQSTSQPDSSVRVQPLTYQQITGLDVWPRLINAVALAVSLSAVSMIGGGLTALWLYGYFGPSPRGVSNSLAQLVLVVPSIAMGIALLIAAIAVLGKASWGLTCMRVTLYIAVAGFVCVGALRMVVGMLQSSGGNTTMLYRYQAVLSFTGALSQLALPLLALFVLRVYRQSTGRGRVD